MSNDVNSKKDETKKELPKQPVYYSDLTRKQQARMSRVSSPTKREVNRDWAKYPPGTLATD